jgi:hypothetical protein
MTHTAGRPLLRVLLNKLARCLTGLWEDDHPHPHDSRLWLCTLSMLATRYWSSIVRYVTRACHLAPCTTANDPPD